MENKAETIIDFENIYANYGNFQALKNINLKIKSDENWAILGANGSGKSTLIKLLTNDLYPNTSYEFKKELFGKDRWNIFELKKLLGIITNELHVKFMNCESYITVEDVVTSGYHSSIGSYKHHVFSEDELKRAEKTMKFLNILNIRDKKVHELSTGQLRLAIIGRALIHSPKAFILDEPTVGLDIKAQRTFIKLFEKISKETPIILITHDISEIFPRITNVALIHNQTVYKQGKKEDVLTSENLSEIFETRINLKEKDGRYFII